MSFFLFFVNNNNGLFVICYVIRHFSTKFDIYMWHTIKPKGGDSYKYNVRN